MYAQTAISLLDLESDKITEWLDSFDTVVTDCDGVLWNYGNVIENSPAVINRFKQMGKKVFLCTNNATKTQQELYEKAINMGFAIELEEVLNTSRAAALYLKSINFNKKVYVISTDAICKELDAVNIETIPPGPEYLSNTLENYLRHSFKLDTNVGAVFIGFDEHFSFPKMIKAATYLNDPNCLFIASNTDENFPTPNMIIPGTGCFVRCIETSTERKALVIGKPNKYICEHLINDGTINPARTLMIGDRCNTDILFGYNCGFQTLLVGSGIHTLKHVKQWQQSTDPELKKLIPDVYLPKLGDLLSHM